MCGGQHCSTAEEQVRQNSHLNTGGTELHTYTLHDNFQVMFLPLRLLLVNIRHFEFGG